jgi:hypothetical protein
MKRSVWFACVLTMLSCGIAFAASLEDFGNKMSYFYLSPSREAFDAFQHDADQFSGKLKSTGNGADALVSVMIARISQKYGWPITGGVLGAKAAEILAGTSLFAKFVSDDTQINPTKLDIWWSSFFATGDERYLEYIYRYAGQEMPKGDIERTLVIGAASWSFKSNCIQHKKVLEFARKKLALNAASEKQMQFLRDCIAGSEAENNAWISRDGKPVPNSDAMKSVRGFGGWLMVTPDADWKEKWNTSPDTAPTFRGASTVEYGERLTILTFFSNPKTDAGGAIQVLCDIKLTRPDGSVPIDPKGIDCASGKLQGNSRNVRLTSAVIDFIGEDGDPPGVWRIEVNLTDKNRNVTVPLKAEFTLNKKRASQAVTSAR